MKKTIKLGTRRSKLALWQAFHIKDLIESKTDLMVQIVEIDTKGDLVLDKSFSKIGSKGLFTEELEALLQSGELDIVQHSAKDVQASLPADLELIAFTSREKANDVLISYNPDLQLNPDSDFVVGTSSTRRVAMLRHFYPKVKTVEMRGNLQTRMQKLKDGQADAILLAFAGAHRMGLDSHMVQQLDMNTFTPAVGQGSVAIQCAVSLNEQVKNKVIEACNDKTTQKCIETERAFLKHLEGGCSIPIFGYAKMMNDNIEISGGIISLDGRVLLKENLAGNDPNQLGKQLAENLIQKGAQKILDDIKLANR